MVVLRRKCAAVRRDALAEEAACASRAICTTAWPTRWRSSTCRPVAAAHVLGPPSRSWLTNALVAIQAGQCRRARRAGARCWACCGERRDRPGSKRRSRDLAQVPDLVAAIRGVEVTLTLDGPTASVFPAHRRGPRNRVGAGSPLTNVLRHSRRRRTRRSRSRSRRTWSRFAVTDDGKWNWRARLGTGMGLPGACGEAGWSPPPGRFDCQGRVRTVVSRWRATWASTPRDQSPAGGRSGVGPPPAFAMLLDAEDDHRGWVG